MQTGSSLSFFVLVLGKNGLKTRLSRYCVQLLNTIISVPDHL